MCGRFPGGWATYSATYSDEEQGEDSVSGRRPSPYDLSFLCPPSPSFFVGLGCHFFRVVKKKIKKSTPRIHPPAVNLDALPFTQDARM